MTTPWTEEDIPDLHGQTWLITGAGSGIGRETAIFANTHGARLVLACRDLDKAKVFAQTLRKAEVFHLELSSFDSIRTAARECGPIDVLINNAGVGAATYQLTEDGFEYDWAVNFLGPFLFTKLILPKIRRRIVITGSLAHQWAQLDLDDPNFEHRKWTIRAAYAQSKLAAMLWAVELNKRLLEVNSAVDIQIAHPGWAATNLGLPAVSNSILFWGAKYVAPILAQSARQGALSTMYAATGDLKPGSCVGPSGAFQIRGNPMVVSRADNAQDPQRALDVWEYAERVLQPHLDAPGMPFL